MTGTLEHAAARAARGTGGAVRGALGAAVVRGAPGAARGSRAAAADQAP